MATKGRRKGPSTVPFALRLRPEQRRDLELLRELIDGAPPINGLIQLAVERYIASKLEEPSIRAEYERRLTPRLQVVRDASGGRQ